METEVPSAPASSERLPWYALATLAALLPAVGAQLSVQGVMDVFRGMAITGSGGIGTTMAGMSEANRPLLFAAVAAAALAGWLGIAVIRRPQRAAAFPGVLFSLAPLLGCVPALLLWITEGVIMEVLAAEKGPVGEASQKVANLMIASSGASITVIPIVFAALAVALARRRPRSEPGLPPAAVWAAMTALLLGLTVLFYVRSSSMYQAALAGHL